MREILFKAKRIYNGEWVEGYYAKRHGVPYIYENADCPQSIYEIDADTICQYTGFTDKNGRKIWENDVCIRTLLPTKRIKTNFRIAYVHLKCCLSAIDLEGRNITFLSDYINNQYEVDVIGNIFDNTDLLEKAR